MKTGPTGQVATALSWKKFVVSTNAETERMWDSPEVMDTRITVILLSIADCVLKLVLNWFLALISSFVGTLIVSSLKSYIYMMIPRAI